MPQQALEDGIGGAMSLYQVVRIVIGVVLSGVIGWISLLVFNALKIWQQFEAFEAAGSRGADLGIAPSAIEKAIYTMQGGSAVFLAAGIAGVLLGEVFRTRSLVFYVGATGALTALFAAAFWHEGGPLATAPAASALAMAGFVAGGIYWMIASPSNS
jgi:hypothetical protein